MCLTMFVFEDSIMPQKGTQEESVAVVHTNGMHVEKDRTLEQIISVKHVAGIFVMPASRTFTARAKYKQCFLHLIWQRSIASIGLLVNVGSDKLQFTITFAWYHCLSFELLCYIEVLQ